jgi:hypothetical protein
VRASALAPSPARHLLWETFSSRIHVGPPSVEPLAGKPRALFFIDPGGSRIGLRLFTKADSLPLSPLVQLDVRTARWGREDVVEISTSNEALFRDFYALGCSIADRVQLDRQEVGVALAETIRALEALLRRKTLLTEDAQVGLIGELLFLKRLAAEESWSVASRAWQGPGNEEHDFTLSNSDIEVKTTRGEQRVHCISSLRQMLPKPKRPLLLISVQVTAALQSKSSFSLASLISSIVARAPQADAKLCLERLEQRGWVSADSHLYSRPFQLRSPMLAIRVNQRFPAIVPTTLAGLGGGNLARIRGVTYWIDVDGLGVLDGTTAFARLIKENR